MITLAKAIRIGATASAIAIAASVAPAGATPSLEAAPSGLLPLTANACVGGGGGVNVGLKIGPYGTGITANVLC